MARPRVRIDTALLLTGLLTQAAPSLAAQPPGRACQRGPRQHAPSLAPKLDLEGPEAEAKERARVLFQQGVASYRDGKFYEAVAIFLQTQRIYPDTQLCFNIARAYENLGNGSAALRYYRDYLRQADRPSDGVDVRERVRKLSQQLAQRGVQQLTVLSQPESATVLLDGKPVGITPLDRRDLSRQAPARAHARRARRARASRRGRRLRGSRRLAGADAGPQAGTSSGAGGRCQTKAGGGQCGDAAHLGHWVAAARWRARGGGCQRPARHLAEQCVSGGRRAGRIGGRAE